MSQLIDPSFTAWLWLLADWSLRWGLMILILAVWFAVRPPRAAALRLLSMRCVLLAGLALPLVPQFWGPAIPRNHKRVDPRHQRTAPAVSDFAARHEQLPIRPLRGIVPDADPLEANAGAVTTSSVTGPKESNSIPASNPPDAERLVIAVLFFAWTAGVLIQTLRLVIGWGWLIRLRRNAAAVDDGLQAELDQLRTELGIRRSAGLCMHPLVDAPILLGGLFPRVLVPIAWSRFPIASRRVILLHEMAHVQRRDDQCKVVEEVVRIVFFFHPLVHWLLARINADREELCDAVVVNHGISPRELAGVLLETCRSCVERRSFGALRGAALPFFRQRTVKNRISFLMEDRAMSWMTLRPSRRAVAGVLAFLLTLFLGVAGWGLRAEEAPPAKSEALPVKVFKGDGKSAEPIMILDLSSLISPESLPDLQDEGTIEIKGFGLFTLEQLVSSAMVGKEGITSGRLVDIAGNPIVAHGEIPAAARISVVCRDPIGPPPRSDDFPVLADAKGRFAVICRDDDGKIGGMIAIGVQTSDGNSFETQFLPVYGKMVDVHIPTHLNPKVAPPTNVAPDELAGVVVDEAGKPVSGVIVEFMDGLPCCMERNLTTTTDKLGYFRITVLDELLGKDKPRTVWVRFRKPGYAPERFLRQPLGVPGWVVALGSQTYLEGTVRGPDGAPAPNATIRANQGPRELHGAIIDQLWTDTTADGEGHYRLYVQPDEYELSVRAPGVGAAHLAKQPVTFGTQRRLDIDLKPGATLQATIVDSQTNQAVPNVRLWHFQHPGVEGRSDANGKVTIPDMIPGEFEFDVEATGYARWWSQSDKSERNRRAVLDLKSKLQRNFDSLDFDLQPGVNPVTIQVERAVRIRGRVIDPDGLPVGGAVVAPALTGTGNSLTGDTRFSVETAADGTFDLRLPASGKARYNLVAHDGKYLEWRKWANGVGVPFHTFPGQEIEGVELKLTRPGRIQGKVVDAKGVPAAGIAVSAAAIDKLDNRYYTPAETTTDAAGAFEINFLRPGTYQITTKGQLLINALLNHAILLREGENVEKVEIRVTTPAAVNGENSPPSSTPMPDSPGPSN